jgi:DNA-binding SARP family transcriptional activator
MTKTQCGQSQTVVRPRLLAELSSDGEPARCAVITAPAGFGKSTLLAQYARSFGGSVGWFSLNPAHADPDVFTADLHETLRPLAADQGSHPAPGRLPAFTEPTLLVIDDIHYLDDTAAERALDQLLAELPEPCHLAIASRRLPGINLARHELTDMRFVDADQLRFRTWEIDLLLRQNYQEPLPASDIATLERRLGGWAAGLHLFHLSTRGRPLPERRAAVAALTGRTSLAHSYMSRIVLSELPDELLSFLTRISVFDVATADRCNRLLGIDDAAALLAELHRRQVFITTTDGGHTYRCHEAMRSHLAAVLADESGESAARRLHSAAAQIAQDDGALVEAARCHARAEDWQAVSKTLEALGPEIVGEDVDHWRDLLPDWLVADDPWLAMAEGRNRLGRGQIAAAVACFERAQQLSVDETGRSYGREAAALARVWLPGPARASGHWLNWVRAATQRHPALVGAAAEDRLPEPFGRLVATIAYTLGGDLESARSTLRSATTGGDGVTAVAVPLANAILTLVKGPATTVSRGFRDFSQIAAAAEAERLPWIARLARAAVALNGTEDAAKVGRQVAEECEADGDEWGACVAMTWAQLARLGEDEPDLATLAELPGRFRALDAAVLETWAQCVLAVAAAHAALPDAEAEIDRAAELVRRCGVEGLQPLVYAAAAVAAGHPPNLVARARQAASHFGFRLPLVESWLRDPQSAAPPRREGALAVTCFGGFRMSRDDVEVDFSSVKPKVRALMRLLAIHAGRPVHREVIIDALWPQSTTRAATHGLHVAMSSLRKLLEPEAGRGEFRFLAREGDAYRLVVPEGAYCDVIAVRDAAQAARIASDRNGDEGAASVLRRAVDVYRGDLLPEDGAAEWVVEERERLRLAASTAGADLARLELERGDVAAALAAAGRSVSINRFNDAGWRLLIEAHERHGDQAAAADARTRYAALLAELGVDSGHE